MAKTKQRSGERNAVKTTAVAVEIARFEAQAADWWDANGPFRPLHALNPARLSFIRDHVVRHFGLDADAYKPFAGLTALDVGCGGGLLAEPLARLGAKVVGIDAGEANVAAARVHAAEVGLTIEYRCALPEELAAAGESFDLVLNMEVVEHVTDLSAFLGACAQLVKPKGAMAIATLNRTLKSLALGKVVAEYVLRWLPPGTHDWRKFVRPSELSAALAPHDMRIVALSGATFDPLTASWRLASDLGVNYLAFAIKD